MSPKRVNPFALHPPDFQVLSIILCSASFYYFFKYVFIYFREGRGRNIDWLPPTPPRPHLKGDGARNSGIYPDQESTGNPWVHGMVLNQLSHSS